MRPVPHAWSAAQSVPRHSVSSIVIMQAALSTRSSVSAFRVAAPRRPHVKTAVLPANVITTVAEVAERTGTVDAPIGYAVGIGIVVALAGTLIIPLALKPGQEAADQIFDSRGRPVTKTSAKKK